MKKREFEQRFVHLLDDIYRFLYHLSGNQQIAEDLTHETYFRARRYRSTLKPDRSAKPWLLKIAHNQYRDWLTKNSLQMPLETIAEKDAPSDLDPEEQFFESVRDDQIRAALRSLPDDFREVVVLRDIHDLSYQEISEVLNCPLGTAMSRLHRARNLLARKLRKLALGRDESEEDPQNLVEFRKRESK